jgi:hypothetical protein
MSDANFSCVAGDKFFECRWTWKFTRGPLPVRSFLINEPLPGIKWTRRPQYSNRNWVDQGKSRRFYYQGPWIFTSSSNSGQAQAGWTWISFHLFVSAASKPNLSTPANPKSHHLFVPKLSRSFQRRETTVLVNLVNLTQLSQSTVCKLNLWTIRLLPWDKESPLRCEGSKHKPSFREP